jgi:hypothetical protein
MNPSQKTTDMATPPRSFEEMAAELLANLDQTEERHALRVGAELHDGWAAVDAAMRIEVEATLRFAYSKSRSAREDAWRDLYTDIYEALAAARGLLLVGYGVAFNLCIRRALEGLGVLLIVSKDSEESRRWLVGEQLRPERIGKALVRLAAEYSGDYEAWAEWLRNSFIGYSDLVHVNRLVLMEASHDGHYHPPNPWGESPTEFSAVGLQQLIAVHFPTVYLTPRVLPELADSAFFQRCKAALDFLNDATKSVASVPSPGLREVLKEREERLRERRRRPKK